jgi:nucleoside-diphosphate-sugar epimerase
MKIGITGSTGTLGTILTSKLKSPFVSCYKDDITNKEEVKKWINSEKFTAVIHLAAFVPVSEVEKNPLKAYYVNVSGMIHLLDALNSMEYPIWFFYASTSHVYKSSDLPITELDELDPINTYGLTKYLAEEILLNYASLKNIDFCIGRIFSFYHPSQKKPYLYPSILERLSSENLSAPFFLKGADSERDILKAEEVVDIIIKLMERKATGIYNIGSGEGIKIKDFVQQLTQTKLNIINDPTVEKNKLVANISKLKSTLDL